MGTRTDAGLTLFVLGATVIAFVAVDASVRWPAAAVGGLGTLAFELVAAGAYDTVREYWERPVVQALSVALSVLGITIGAVVAASIVLSFALGALVTYLGYLGGYRIAV